MDILTNHHTERVQQLENLKLFFDTIDLPSSIVLSTCAVIVDVPKFVKNHIGLIAHNIEKEKLAPVYMARLEQVARILEKREKERKRLNKAA